MIAAIARAATAWTMRRHYANEAKVRLSRGALRHGCILLLGFLGVSTTARAQSTSTEWSAAIFRTKASVVFSPLGSSNGTRGSLAPFIGVSHTAGGRLATRVEAGVVQKGFERTEPTAHWSYLEVPLLLEARFLDTHAPLRPTLQVGLAPSLALSCTVSYVGINGAYKGSCYESDPLHVVEPASHWDVGAVLGGGIRVRLPSAALVVDGRYTRGLHHVERGSTHRVWSLGVGATIPITK